MIEKIIDKRNYLIFALIIILIIFIVISLNTKEKEYSENYNYFGESIIIKLYTSKDTTKIFSKIDDILSKYHEYYKNSSNNTDLIELLEYGKSLYEKTNGYIDITDDGLIKSISNNEDYTFVSSINSLDFTDESTLNNINVDSIIGAYAIKEVEDYLKEKEISKYIINENGNVITGNYYSDGKYKVSITDINNDLVNIVYLENESLAIKGNTTSFETYMVNPITSKKADNKLVVVISKDINEANMIANTLYLMDYEEGKEFISNYEVEVLWKIDDEVIYTNGFSNYIET